MNHQGFLVKLFSWLESKILSSSFQKLLFVMLGLMIVKVGIWQMPNLPSTGMIAQNPFVNAFADTPDAQYLMYSWFSSFVAWCLHLKNLTKFFLLHFCCSIGFVLLFAKNALEKQSLDNAKKSLILFFLFPVSATSFFWVGIDSVTLFLMMLSLYFFKNAKWSFLFACMLGLQHFEQGLFSALVLMFAILLNREKLDVNLKHVAIYLCGILLGKLMLFLIFKSAGIVLVSNRALIAKTTLKLYIQQFFFHFQVIVWSVLGVGWLAVLRLYQLYRSQWAVLLSIFGLVMIITPIIGDQTRVDCIILFPIIWVFLLNNTHFLEKLTWMEVIGGLCLWLFIPWIWVWGAPRWSVFPYDVYYVLHKLFHHLPWPENAWLWPFV